MVKPEIVCMACEAWDEPHAWHEGGQDRRPIEAGGKCWRPKEHEGACGEPLDQAEDERRILYGQCGAPPAPTICLYAGDEQAWLNHPSTAMRRKMVALMSVDGPRRP